MKPIRTALSPHKRRWTVLLRCDAWIRPPYQAIIKGLGCQGRRGIQPSLIIVLATLRCDEDEEKQLNGAKTLRARFPQTPIVWLTREDKSQPDGDDWMEVSNRSWSRRGVLRGLRVGIMDSVDVSKFTRIIREFKYFGFYVQDLNF